MGTVVMQPKIGAARANMVQGWLVARGGAHHEWAATESTKTPLGTLGSQEVSWNDAFYGP